MKKIIQTIFICCLFLSAIKTDARNFYIANSGSDDNAGTSPATAWQHITKLNASFSNINPGDSILFKRGDLFYGAIVLSKSGVAGRPVVIGAYGNGAAPIISGFTLLDNWVDKGNGVWQVPAPMVKSSVNLVTINGIPQQVGRYPDTDEADGGYLRYESFSGNNFITDKQLGATPNWTGAEICIRKDGYILERNKITSHQGNAIGYLPTRTINPRNEEEKSTTPPQEGFGYFIQRDAKTLSKMGEWYFDPGSKTMLLFFGKNTPSNYSIKVSSIDTLINIGDNQFISICNIAFEGPNLAAVYTKDAANLTIKNCSVNCSGAKGFFIWNTPNTLVDNCSIRYAACGAIDITGRYAAGVTVRNCTIINTAVIAGMGSFHDPADMRAINVSVSKNALIEYNKIDTTGYIGIHFQGDSITVQNNFIDYYDFVVDDGGGIYTFSLRNKGRVIQNNIILHGIGAGKGNAYPVHAEGIYSDAASDIYIYNNTVAYQANRGIYLNDPKNITVYKNICYSNGLGWGANKHAADSIYNFSLVNNIFYSVVDSQANFNYFNTGINSPSLPLADNIQEALQQLGNIDSNYYNTTRNDGWSWYYQKKEGGSYTFADGVSFEEWKGYTGLDANSKRPARIAANAAESKLIYNASTKKTTFYLDKKYVDLEGNIYTDSLVLDPYCSKILILATAPLSAPVIPLQGSSIPYKGIASLLAVIGTGAGIVYYYFIKKKKENSGRQRVRVRVRKY